MSIRRFFRRRDEDNDLAQEIQSHIQHEVDEGIARGASEAEARRQAYLRFGNPQQVREEVWKWNTVEFVDSVLRDLRYAARAFRQRPGFVAVALLALALGTGATTIMFTLINGVLLKPLSYPEPEHLVTLHGQTEKYGEQWFAYFDFLDCQKESRSLDIAAWTFAGGTIGTPGDTEYLTTRQISPELFPVLGVALEAGRSFLPEENHPGATPAIIISHNLWQRRYGGRLAVIGTKLDFEGREYTVVGIAPTGFQLDGVADAFVPLGQSTEPRMQNREGAFLRVVARLRHGFTFFKAQAELSRIAANLAKQYPSSNAGRGFVTQPLHQELVADVQPTLWLLLGAVSLLLLIACANVASLLLSRAVSRAREFAVRVALGAGRRRLIRQCLTESTLLALAGGALGVLLATLGIRPLLALWPGSLPRAEEVQLDWHVLLFALVVSVLTGLLFGLAPALRAPARELENTLRGGSRTVAGSSRRLHSSFVISEIALAMVLLACAGMLGRTLLRVSSLDPGLNIQNVLISRLAFSPAALTNPAQTRAAWQQVMDNARRVPGVQAVALTDTVPMREGLDEVGYWTTPAPPPPNQTSLALTSGVTPDYLEVMGIPLLQGRFFNGQDRSGSMPVVVIDEILAQHSFKGQDPVGKPLWLLGIGKVQVVGVVGHVRHWGLAADDQAEVRDQLYFSLANVPDGLMKSLSSVLSLTLRTDVPPLTLVEPLRREQRGTQGDPVIYAIHTMEELARASLARQRFLVLLFMIFATLALLLACVGIYGVLSYLTSQRTPEIGVRMALGATAADVLQLVLQQSLIMIFIGVAMGTAGAIAAGRLLVHLVDGMQPAQPLTLALMTLPLLMAAMLASFVPALRASRLDAISALRSE